MRRALVTTSATSALIAALLALKPHQLAAPAQAAPRSSTVSSSPRLPAGTSTGTYTGDPAETRYGPVQVAATLAQGRLTDVQVLQVPDRNGRDQQIASYALPRLTQEALGAQSAHIDAVSGASYTSQGYIQSLQSALDRAHA
jgi:uncharacterized protein with FMN-binding domain